MSGYAVTDHVCRLCLGRVLRALDGSHHRCADCGLRAAGPVESVCACGTKLRTNLGAGLRCQKNPHAPNLEAPAEVVVVYVGIEHKAQPALRLTDHGKGWFDASPDR